MYRLGPVASVAGLLCVRYVWAMSRRRFKLYLGRVVIDPRKKQIVGYDDFEPTLPGRDPTLPILALADDDDRIIVDDSDRTSVRVED